MRARRRLHVWASLFLSNDLQRDPFLSKRMLPHKDDCLFSYSLLGVSFSDKFPLVFKVILRDTLKSTDRVNQGPSSVAMNLLQLA